MLISNLKRGPGNWNDNVEEDKKSKDNVAKTLIKKVISSLNSRLFDHKREDFKFLSEIWKDSFGNVYFAQKKSEYIAIKCIYNFITLIMTWNNSPISRQKSWYLSSILSTCKQ